MSKTMTKEELAARIDGCEYGRELTDAEIALAKESGLVVVYECSDDLIEFDGAIEQELDVYRGDTVHVCEHGAATEDMMEQPPDGRMQEIEAVWCPPEGGSWAYRTKIPHATFKVMEGEELYCTGIVFDIKDARPPATVFDKLTSNPVALAEFISRVMRSDISNEFCKPGVSAKCDGDECPEEKLCIIRWLQSPAEEG